MDLENQILATEPVEDTLNPQQAMHFLLACVVGISLLGRARQHLSVILSISFLVTGLALKASRVKLYSLSYLLATVTVMR